MFCYISWRHLRRFLSVCVLDTVFHSHSASLHLENENYKSVSHPTFVLLSSLWLSITQKANYCIAFRALWANNCCHTTLPRYNGKALSTQLSKISCLGASIIQTQKFVSHIFFLTSTVQEKQTLLRMKQCGVLRFRWFLLVSTFAIGSHERWVCLNSTSRKTYLKTQSRTMDR